MERKFFEVKVHGVNPSSRTVEGMASFKEVDRMGDLMLPTAFDKKLKTFMSNPVLAWCHNIITMPPLGKVVEFAVRENGPHFKAKFDSDTFSDLIFRKYKSGSMRAFSVQFMPDVVRDATEEEKGIYGASLKRVIEEAELLEISCVPVPAVANALVGKSITDFDMKSFLKMTKEVTEGEGDPPAGETRNLHERIEAVMEMVSQVALALDELLKAAGPREEEEAEPEPADEEPEGGSGHEDEEKPEEMAAALERLNKASKELQKLEEVSA